MDAVYSTLDKDSNEIRLLSLNPGVAEEAISGSLQVGRLTPRPIFDPIYAALSYARGRSEKPKTIQLNGYPFWVTENLYTALKYLRTPGTARVLWIDALCINQSDLDERLHQVQMMAEIYKRAETVLVWLGPPRDDSDAVMDIIESMAFSNHYVQYEVPESKFKVLELLRRSYWSRVWVVQEIAVARSDPLVGCGYKWILWRDMFAGLEKLRFHFHYYRFQIDAGFETPSSKVSDITTSFNNLFDLIRPDAVSTRLSPRPDPRIFLSRRSMASGPGQIRI